MGTVGVIVAILPPPALKQAVNRQTE
jgi:hypothetical protein